MNDLKNGGPAFPLPTPHSDEGMSLRDWFAGLAMQSLIQIGATPIRSHKDWEGKEFEHPDQPFYFGDDMSTETEPHVGYDAYAIADGMLKARNQEATNERA